jgi:hypothetical protein
MPLNRDQAKDRQAVLTEARTECAGPIKGRPRIFNLDQYPKISRIVRERYEAAIDWAQDQLRQVQLGYHEYSALCIEEEARLMEQLRAS